MHAKSRAHTTDALRVLFRPAPTPCLRTTPLLCASHSSVTCYNHVSHILDTTSTHTTTVLFQRPPPSITTSKRMLKIGDSLRHILLPTPIANEPDSQDLQVGQSSQLRRYHPRDLVCVQSAAVGMCDSSCISGTTTPTYTST